MAHFLNRMTKFPSFSDPKNKCMMLKFEIDQQSMDYQEDVRITNKWYKENCKGVRNPTAFLAERSKLSNEI